jgi:hypothetical protein
MGRPLFWLAPAAVLWVLGSGAYGVWSWPEAKAQVTQARDEGLRDCRMRYPEKARQDRCSDLFHLIYESERNTAVFTRVLGVVVPPVLAFGGLTIWSMMRRRQTGGGARGPR